MVRGKALGAMIILCSGFDFLCFGYDQGLLGGILTSPTFEHTVLGQYLKNSTFEGFLGAIYNLGCTIGAAIAFVWGEKLGRVGSIVWAQVILIIGAAIQTASFDYWQMWAGRLVAGVGVGLSTVSVPILQSETMGAHDRGAKLVIQAGLINSGVAVASWLTFGCNKSNSSLQWRFPVAMQMFFAVFVLLTTFFIPETPRWLVSRGRKDEARAVIAQLEDLPEDDKIVDGQLQEILDNYHSPANQQTSWSDTFRNRTPMRNLHRVLIGTAPFLFNQWSGINAITYYLTYTLTTYLDYGQNMALILSSVAFTQYSCFSFAPYLYIDRIGRRWSLMLSAAGCAICMAIVAGCMNVKSYSTGAAVVAFTFFFIDSFCLGILPVSWSYSAEIQPLCTRNKATAVGVMAHWMSNFVIVFITPIGLKSLGGNFYWIWAVVNACFVPLTFFFGVETAGKSLEMIDQAFIEEPRKCMGLNARHREVIRLSKADEENRLRRSSLVPAEKSSNGHHSE